MGLQLIEFDDGLHQSTKANVRAIAWISHKLGKREWEGRNVPRDIAEAIHDHTGGTIKLTVRNASYALYWLDQKGYGVRITEYKRTRAFHWNSNINLAGVYPIDYDEKGTQEDKRLVAAAQLAALDETARQISNGQHPTQPVQEMLGQLGINIPLPGETPLPYRWEEFEIRVKAWAQMNPEGYRRWVDEALGRLPK